MSNDYSVTVTCPICERNWTKMVKLNPYKGWQIPEISDNLACCSKECREKWCEQIEWEIDIL